MKSARRTAYSLMGAGMHGLNGIGPEIAALQYATYVLPTLIYGLETLTLNPNEIKNLSTYHRKNLRYIQHLPQSTALPAVFLLLGAAPIENLLHIRALTLFRNIIAAESNTPPAIYIRDLITRQAAVKDSTSSSWTTTIKKILQTYELPTIVELIDNPPRKSDWRKTVKETINEAWTEALQDEAEKKSTLEFLNIGACKLGQLHLIWQNLSSPLEIQKATVKAQLLVKRYPLATSPTSGVRKNDTCPLCKEEPETTTHFLLQCSTLSLVRLPYISRILDLCRQQSISIDPETLTRIILDSTHLPIPNTIHETTCRNFVFKLHNTRAKILGGESGYMRARKGSKTAKSGVHASENTMKS